MQVKELIKKLQSLNSPESMVVVSGYEGGVREITNAKEVEIMLNVNEAWYYGEHIKVEDKVDSGRKSEIKETAIAIQIY